MECSGLFDQVLLFVLFIIFRWLLMSHYNFEVDNLCKVDFDSEVLVEEVL